LVFVPRVVMFVPRVVIFVPGVVVFVPKGRLIIARHGVPGKLGVIHAS
jgi:hypothetical protein